MWNRRPPSHPSGRNGESANALTNESASGPAPVGCETLSEGTAPILADVVFVHGLRGHRIDSWRKGSVCWPRDLLPKEGSVSNVRILTFGYDANIVGRTSLNSLFEHSINLLNELSRERRGSARGRPIVFVAHSLGGLIVKDALDHSDTVRDTRPHIAPIFTATRGVIFLGTPHRGSDMTTLAKLVTFVAKVSLNTTNSSLIRDLERDSQTLDRIRDSFSRILSRRTLTVWSFEEELPMPGVGKVVSGESAIIGDARENRDTIHADHIGMCRFSDGNDLGYKKVLHAIETVLEGISGAEAAPTSIPTAVATGCETLSPGTAPIVADIVFVHGLRGHRIDTWNKGGVCWPRDLLPKEEWMSHVRILTFGYDANVVDVAGRASMNTLFEHSINLLNELSRERRGAARTRPIIFVTHSLGGLIVKDALDHSNSVRETIPLLASTFTATLGVVFLGTPHRGSGMTTLAKLVTFVAKVSLNITNSSLIRDLERDSQTLDRIRDSFSRILARRSLTVWSFEEELPMPGMGKVVSGESAIINDAREMRGTIHADHIGMCKFSDKRDPGYKKVSYAIEVLLEQINLAGAV